MTNEQHREMSDQMTRIETKLDQVIKIQDDHETRIRPIERFVTHAKATFLLVGGAIGYLFKLWPLALVFLGSCYAGPDGAEKHWHHHMDFVIDENMSVECEEAAGEAVVYFMHHDVRYMGARFVADPPVRFGDVAVYEADLSDVAAHGCPPGAECVLAGLTHMNWWAHRLTKGYIFLDSAHCDPMVAAHEFGHALGLEHNDTLGNLMYPYTFGMGWDLNEDQLDWIR